MSLQNPTKAWITPFTVVASGGANTTTTATINADTVLQDNQTNSQRQIVILSIDVTAANASATPIAASTILFITTTGLSGTPTWPFANAFPAWTTVTLLSRQYGEKEGGLFVPFVTSGAQNGATFAVPACGLNVTTYVTVNGIYI